MAGAVWRGAGGGRLGQSLPSISWSSLPLWLQVLRRALPVDAELAVPAGRAAGSLTGPAALINNQEHLPSQRSGRSGREVGAASSAFLPSNMEVFKQRLHQAG